MSVVLYSLAVKLYECCTMLSILRSSAVHVVVNLSLIVTAHGRRSIKQGCQHVVLDVGNLGGVALKAVDHVLKMHVVEL